MNNNYLYCLGLLLLLAAKCSSESKPATTTRIERPRTEAATDTAAVGDYFTGGDIARSLGK